MSKLTFNHTLDDNATSLPDHAAKTSCAKSISNWKRSSQFSCMSVQWARIALFAWRVFGYGERVRRQIGDLWRTTLYFDFPNSRELVIKARVLLFITADDDQYNGFARSKRQGTTKYGDYMTWPEQQHLKSFAKCWRFTSASNPMLILPKNYHILPSNGRRSMEISFSEWMNNFEAGEKGEKNRKTIKLNQRSAPENLHNCSLEPRREKEISPERARFCLHPPQQAPERIATRQQPRKQLWETRGKSLEFSCLSRLQCSLQGFAELKCFSYAKRLVQCPLSVARSNNGWLLCFKAECKCC